MCKKKKEERGRERQLLSFLSFHPLPFFYGVDNLWMLFGNENPITEVII